MKLSPKDLAKYEHTSYQDAFQQNNSLIKIIGYFQSLFILYRKSMRFSILLLSILDTKFLWLPI